MKKYIKSHFSGLIGKSNLNYLLRKLPKSTSISRVYVAKLPTNRKPQLSQRH